MKILRSLIAVLAIGVAAMSTANARDSFSLGISIGGHSHVYDEPVRYYSAPPVVYYAAPTYYYEPVRSYYHSPIVSFGFHSGGDRYYRGHHGHHARHGWGNGHRGHRDGHRGGWRHGLTDPGRPG